VTTIWTGLSVGAVYALVALGYNIVFLASGALNFANAALIMLGIFITYWALSTEHLPFPVAILIAAAAVTAVAFVQERVGIRPVKSMDGLLVTTVGAATILAGVTQVIWGSSPLAVPFVGSGNPFTFLGGRVLADELALIVAAVALSAAVWIALRRTMMGLAFLASSEDQEASTLRGLDARRLRLLAFGVSGFLAGAAACLIGPTTLAYPDLGSTLALDGFVALALGGFGSVLGGLVGGLATGLIEAVVASQLGGSYSNIVVFGVLLLVLLARPGGLLGNRLRERVV
jgi:branched-chain amino acid transport system permease protein